MSNGHTSPMKTVSEIVAASARAAVVAMLGIATWVLVTVQEVRLTAARIEEQNNGIEHRLSTLEQRVTILEGERRRRE